jgi:two-component system LytT family response regulator
MDSTNISAFIIDDEPEAIQLLEMYLRFFPNVKVIGKETQAKNGLDFIFQNLPDLIFLDIDMPEMSGLQVAEQIHAENFYSEIVFTTAHPKYGYYALDFQPLDFLTKPFSVEDVETVIHKYQNAAEKKKYLRKVDLFIQSQSNSPKVKLPTINGVLITEIKNIVLLKAKANNCSLYLHDGTIETITRNLNNLAEIINSQSLFKISRSTYINLKYLKKIDKKNLKCLVSFNQSVLEEDITKSNLLHFEKLDLFPPLSGH